MSSAVTQAFKDLAGRTFALSGARSEVEPVVARRALEQATVGIVAPAVKASTGAIRIAQAVQATADRRVWLHGFEADASSGETIAALGAALGTGSAFRSVESRLARLAAVAFKTRCALAGPIRCANPVGGADGGASS